MSQNHPYRFARGVFGIWAGVSLAGSLVAAPAKFQAESLTRTVALDVGRAQFHWLGITEALVCLVVVLSLLRGPRPKWRWPAVALGLLALQRLVIMPPLDARTLQVIAGETVAPNSLHVIYVVVEVVKFLVLGLLATGVLKMSPPDSPPDVSAEQL